MNKRGLAVVVILVFTFIFATGELKAQFEGTLTYNRYEVDKNTGNQKAAGSFNVLFAKNRILLTGLEGFGNVHISVMGDTKTEGVLIRFDSEDVIFLTGNGEALKVSRKDMQMLSGFMRGFSETKSGPLTQALETTKEIENIHGYTTRRYVLRDTENSGQLFEIWMTDDLNINWGMLQDKWVAEMSELVAMNGKIIDQILQKNALPLFMKKFENGVLTDIIEVTNVDKTPPPMSRVDIPSGTNVVSLQQYMMKKLSGN